ncbi:hypothetical protein [Actinomadura rudentiformis]|uniref:Uncharacterized protein n=1 Tax=Actinomadura rudentiformis TaxID=359158 RepID=A0A6H9YKB7_9ACTN|nr:hypothetical protein [Actinomadura rudentiformis]KAB2344863.1 hypothetical protein F8566_30185 [Actinomadura rudentiformis]
MSAAAHFRRAPSTIRCWAHRYHARRLGVIGRTVWYDLRDLAVIDREIRHGRPVPETWEARAELLIS